MRTKEIRLKHNEIGYLLDLLYDHRTSGTYWGRKDYFFQRQERVISKLEQALNTKVSK